MEQKIRLMDDANACFLIKIGGSFEGKGELAEIKHDKEKNHWYLHGKGFQAVELGAACIKYSLKRDS